MGEFIVIILKTLKKFIYFVFGFILGKIIYSREYFPRGKYFERWYSIGWEWTIRDFCGRLLFGKNKGIKWPVSPFLIMGGDNIEFDIDDLDNFQSPNCYYQSYDAKIVIGKGTMIAQGTGIITSNHDVYNLNERAKCEDVLIGESCWIGMNSMILPGVILGNNTIVGAGSVVTRSFPEGNCIIAGNPAKMIKQL